MKPIKYNYYLPWEDGRTLFFNGLTQRFFFVEPANSDEFKKVIEQPDNYTEKYNSFIERMQASPDMHGYMSEYRGQIAQRARQIKVL